jgi:hypothetical protein
MIIWFINQGTENTQALKIHRLFMALDSARPSERKSSHTRRDDLRVVRRSLAEALVERGYAVHCSPSEAYGMMKLLTPAPDGRSRRKGAKFFFFRSYE